MVSVLYFSLVIFVGASHTCQLKLLYKQVFYCVQFVVFSFANQPNVRTRELGGKMAIVKFTILFKKTHYAHRTRDIKYFSKLAGML